MPSPLPARRLAGLLMAAALLAGCAARAPENRDLILVTTTSTQDSGLLDVLVPLFEQQSGYRVKTLAVGTGQALAMGERGEADVMLVHAPADEEEIVARGAAVNRRLVMHNDFVLAGPADDPAGVRGEKTAAGALKRIAAARSLFVSRGDDSGTHKKELWLWQVASVQPEGNWYQQSGAGMGQTLSIAAEKDGYTLTDRATFLATRQNHRLEILLAGDAPLLNIYHVMQVNPERFSKVNAAGARAFSDFLLGQAAQAAIAQFGTEKYGQPLFFADGGKTAEQLATQN